MKQELIIDLIKKLFETDKLHLEYNDNNSSYVIDILKKNNTLNILISLDLNKDKKEFEAFLQTLDDEIFEATLESLKDEIKDLDKLYNSENYNQVINAFKQKLKEIIQYKINYLQSLIK